MGTVGPWKAARTGWVGGMGNGVGRGTCVGMGMRFGESGARRRLRSRPPPGAAAIGPPFPPTRCSRQEVGGGGGGADCGSCPPGRGANRRGFWGRHGGDAGPKEGVGGRTCGGVWRRACGQGASMSGRNRHPQCPSNGRPFQEARMAARQAAGSPDQADAAAAGAVDPPLHTHIDSKPNRGLRSWWWCRWRRRSTQEPLVEAGLGVGESEAARDWRSVCRLSMAGCLWRRSYCRETAPEDKPHVRRRTWLWRLPDSLIICLRRFDNECRKVVPQNGRATSAAECQSLRRVDNECRKVSWHRRSATCLKTTIYGRRGTRAAECRSPAAQLCGIL